jgi:hypothetical protein
MNRRTFLAALGFAPAVAATKPIMSRAWASVPVPLIAMLRYRFHGDSLATLELLNTSAGETARLHGFNSGRSLGGGIALCLTDHQLACLHLFVDSAAFNRRENSPCVADEIVRGIESMLEQQDRPPATVKVLRISTIHTT